MGWSTSDWAATCVAPFELRSLSPNFLSQSLRTLVETLVELTDLEGKGVKWRKTGQCGRSGRSGRGSGKDGDGDEDEDDESRMSQAHICHISGVSRPDYACIAV